VIEEREVLHLHGFCGLGGGAEGFNLGSARVGNMRAKFRCLGGFDVDPAAIRDFDRATGVKGTVLDLFSREQYTAFHGHEPPPGWREATPDDIRRSAGYEKPHIFFCSAPCKGFSGLLSETRSQGAKYQALNQLALRALWLLLEAYQDDPIELILFENVPRIVTRGAGLLEQAKELMSGFGYAVSPVDERSYHDCGELGALAQSRKRFLMIGRHAAKVPAFLYEPPRFPLRAVGEILGKMPLPGDPAGGPMHAIPRLQWKTWVRLAFVEAGSDWRSLNKLNVKDGYLADYLIVPDGRNGDLGVVDWSESAKTIIGNAKSNNGPFSVADPRQEAFEHGYGVAPWDKAARTVQGQSLPSNGPFSVADPRFQGESYRQYGVIDWQEHAATVTGQRSPGQGPFSVSDPRMPESPMRQNGLYRVVRWNGQAGSVTGASHVAGAAMSIADPRPTMERPFGKYGVTPWDGNTGTVIGGHRSEEGAYAVADPRQPRKFTDKKYRVTHFEESAGSVIGASTTGQGAFAVADPRIELQREKSGHYGVIPWESPSGAVTGSAGHDNGTFSVADPRMPTAKDKLVCVIRSLDNTWHRPFTTLELAALQSLVDPDEVFGFDLDGKSDSAKRERIGNAVPPDAAKAIASVMGETLLLVWSGSTFQLSAQSIWVKPFAVALSVKTPEVV